MLFIVQLDVVYEHPFRLGTIDSDLVESMLIGAETKTPIAHLGYSKLPRGREARESQCRAVAAAFLEPDGSK